MVPFKGALEGTVTSTVAPPFAQVVITAEGNANELGHFRLSIPHQVDLRISVGTGSYLFTAANGDELHATFTGKADTSAPVFVIEEKVTIVGGTGRFANASGSFSAHRLFDPAAGTTTGTFEGTINVPGTR
jgi:hypothetical protein